MCHVVLLSLLEIKIREEKEKDQEEVQRLDDKELASIFRDFNLIAGSPIVLEHGGQRLEGLVKTMDPVNGLLLQTSDGERMIDSDRVHLIDW